MEKMIYVLEGQTEFEGRDAIGVYTKVEDAENAMKDYVAESEYIVYSGFRITMFTVGEKPFNEEEELEFDEDEQRPYNYYDRRLIVK